MWESLRWAGAWLGAIHSCGQGVKAGAEWNAGLCGICGRRESVRATRVCTGDASLYGQRESVRATRVCKGDASL